jgi:hypothetical protein
VANPVKSAGTYYVGVTDAVGCTTTSGIVVDSFRSVPVAKEIQGDTTVCINQTITLTDSVIGGRWGSLQAQVAGVGSTTGVVTGDNFGTADIRYIVTNSCGADSVFHTVQVVGKKPAIAPVVTQPSCLTPSGGVLKFGITGTEGPYQFSYQGNYYAADTDSIGNLQPGSYDVTFYNKYMCQVGSTTVNLVLVSDASCDTLYVPTGFLPGVQTATGKDNYLKPFGGSQAGIASLQFRVYNRYGNLVFISNDLNSGWDGRCNGVPQDIGTYVWYLDYTLAGSNRRVSLKGTTVLIR